MSVPPGLTGAVVAAGGAGHSHGSGGCGCSGALPTSEVVYSLLPAPTRTQLLAQQQTNPFSKRKVHMTNKPTKLDCVALNTASNTPHIQTGYYRICETCHKGLEAGICLICAEYCHRGHTLNPTFFPVERGAKPPTFVCVCGNKSFQPNARSCMVKDHTPPPRQPVNPSVVLQFLNVQEPLIPSPTQPRQDLMAAIEAEMNTIFTRSELYDRHAAIRCRAPALLSVAEPIKQETKEPAKAIAAVAEKSSFATDFLLAYMAAGATDPAQSAIFWRTFNLVITKHQYKPLSIQISPSEQVYYNQIAEMCVSLGKLNGNQNKALIGDVLQNLVRLWLGLGSLQHTLQAVDFLMSQCLTPPRLATATASAASDAAPALQLRSFVSAWAQEMDTQKRRRFLTLSESEHSTDLPAAPRVHFNIVSPRLTLTVSPATTTLVRRPAVAAAATAFTSSRDPAFPFLWRHQWDLWDFQIGSLWYGFEENPSKALEFAYLEGKHSVELEGFGTVDFLKNTWLDKTGASHATKPIRRRDTADFDTIYEFKGVRPSITHDAVGAYLFLLSPEYGLVKIGTGTAGGTATGKVYAQNRTLAIHAGGHIAVLPSTDPTAPDVLLIRTPLLGPYALLRVSTANLLVLDDARIQLAISDEKDVTVKLPAEKGDAAVAVAAAAAIASAAKDEKAAPAVPTEERLKNVVYYSLEYADIWSDEDRPKDSEDKSAVSPADLEPGDFTDCKDTVNKWCVARVLKVDDQNKNVWVHFEGWQDKWNEWIPRNSHRLAKFRTFTGGKDTSWQATQNQPKKPNPSATDKDEPSAKVLNRWLPLAIDSSPIAGVPLKDTIPGVAAAPPPPIDKTEKPPAPAADDKPKKDKATEKPKVEPVKPIVAAEPEKLEMPFIFGRSEQEALTQFLCSNWQFGDTFTLSPKAVLHFDEDGIFLRAKYKPKQKYAASNAGAASGSDATAAAAAADKPERSSRLAHRTLLVTRVRIKHSHYTRDHLLPIYAPATSAVAASGNQSLLVLNSTPALPLFDMLTALLAQTATARQPRVLPPPLVSMPSLSSPPAAAAAAPAAADENGDGDGDEDGNENSGASRPVALSFASPAKDNSENSAAAAAPAPAAASAVVATGPKSESLIADERTRQSDILKSILAEVQRTFPAHGASVAIDTYVLSRSTAIVKRRDVYDRTKRLPALVRQRSAVDGGLLASLSAAVQSLTSGVSNAAMAATAAAAAAAAAASAAGQPVVVPESPKPVAAAPPVVQKPAISQENLAMLLSMGVTQNRAEKALIATKNRSVDSAFEWLTDHSGDADIVADTPWTPPPPVVQPTIKAPSVAPPTTPTKSDVMGGPHTPPASSKKLLPPVVTERDDDRSDDDSAAPTDSIVVESSHIRMTHASRTMLDALPASMRGEKHVDISEGLFCNGCGISDILWKAKAGGADTKTEKDSKGATAVAAVAVATPKEHKGAELYACTDAACRDQNLVLCHFCRLLGRFECTDGRGSGKEMIRTPAPAAITSRYHTASHSMELIRTPLDKNWDTILRTKLSPPHTTYPTLAVINSLPDLFRCRLYFDPVQNTLTALTHIGAPAGKVRRRQMFDVATGSRLSDSIVQRVFSRAYTLVAPRASSDSGALLWGIGAGGLLQRFECVATSSVAAAAAPSAPEAMDGLDAVSVILDHLPCVANSEAVIRAALKSLASALQFVTDATETDDSKRPVSVGSIAARVITSLKRFIVAIGRMHHPSQHPYGAELAAVRSLLERIHKRAGSQALTISAARDALTEGFELFYPAWNERVAVLTGKDAPSDLLLSIGQKYADVCTGARSAQSLVFSPRDINYLVRCPRDSSHFCHFYGAGRGPSAYFGSSYNCDVCSAKSQQFTVGWFHCNVCTNLDVCPACYPTLAATNKSDASAQASALTRSVADSIIGLIRQSMANDQKQLTAATSTFQPHWSTPFVLQFLSQVSSIQSYGPNKPDATESFGAIASVVFQSATTLINSYYQPNAEWKVYQSGIFALLAWCVGGLTAADMQFVAPLTLQALLTSLNSLVLVTGQHTSADSVRHKLARVRASGVLLRPVWKSTSASASPAASPAASKEREKDSKTPKSDSAALTAIKRKLLPAVEAVFTDIFNEFASFEVPYLTGSSGALPPGANARSVKLMSGPDFVRFQRSLSEATLKDPFKRGLRTTRETRNMNQQFLHYASFASNAAASAFEEESKHRKSGAGDEKKSAAGLSPVSPLSIVTKSKKRNKTGESLVLEGLYLDVRCFIRLMRDQCVNSPEKVLDELSFLEHNFDFPNSERAHLPRLARDAKVALAHLLNHLYAASARGGTTAKSKDVVLKLLESRDYLRQNAAYKSHSAFLLRFVNSDINEISQIASSKQVRFPDALSAFFRHCLNELGGAAHAGTASALAAEKSFAAALIKHSDLTEVCIEFCRGMDFGMLISKTVKKSIRCMFHPKLPAWFKNIVYAVNREIRRPVIALLTDPVVGADLVARNEVSHAPASATAAAVATAATGTTAAAANADLKSRDDFKSGKSEKDGKEVAAESLEQKIAALVRTRVSVWRDNALFLLQDFELESSATALTATPIRAGAGAGGATATPKRTPTTGGSTASPVVGLPEDDKEDEALTLTRTNSSNVNDTNPPAATATTAAAAVTSTPTKLDASSSPASTGVLSLGRSNSNANKLDGAAVAAKKSLSTEWITNIVRTDVAMDWNELRKSIERIQMVSVCRVKVLEALISCFRPNRLKELSASSAAVASSASTLTRNEIFLTEELLPLVWNCVRAPNSKPKHLLYVQQRAHRSTGVGASASSYQSPEQIEGAKNLLTLYKLITQTLRTLLDSVSPTNLELWCRVKPLLQMFYLEFDSAHRELILGSGILSVLSTFVQRIDHSLIDPLHVQAKETHSEMEASLIALLRIKNWCWKTFLYCCSYTLYNGKSDDSASASASATKPDASPAVVSPTAVVATLTPASSDESLGSMISSNLLLLLTRNLDKLRASLPTGAIRPLAAGAIAASRGVMHDLELKLEMNIVYQTVDILRLLQHTSTQAAVCTPAVVRTLIDLLLASKSGGSGGSSGGSKYALPAIVQIAIVQFLRFELVRHHPNEFTDSNKYDISAQLLRVLGHQLLETRFLSKQSRVENQLAIGGGGDSKTRTSGSAAAAAAAAAAKGGELRHRVYHCWRSTHQSRYALRSNLVALFRMLLTTASPPGSPQATSWASTVHQLLMRHAIRTADVLQSLRARSDTRSQVAAPAWIKDEPALDSKDDSPKPNSDAKTGSGSGTARSFLSSFMTVFSEVGSKLAAGATAAGNAGTITATTPLSPTAAFAFAASTSTATTSAQRPGPPPGPIVALIPSSQVQDSVSSTVAALLVLGAHSKEVPVMDSVVEVSLAASASSASSSAGTQSAGAAIQPPPLTVTGVVAGLRRDTDQVTVVIQRGVDSHTKSYVDVPSHQVRVKAPVPAPAINLLEEFKFEAPVSTALPPISSPQNSGSSSTAKFGSVSLLSVLISSLREAVPAGSDVYSLVFTHVQKTALSLIEHCASNAGADFTLANSTALASVLFGLAAHAPTKYFCSSEEIELRSAVYSKRLLEVAAQSGVSGASGVSHFLANAKTPFDDQIENSTGKGAASGSSNASSEPEKDIEMPLLLSHLQNVIGLGMCSDGEAKLALCAQGGDVNAAMNNILSGNLPRNRSEQHVNDEWNALLTRLNIRETVEAYERQQIRKAQRAEQAKKLKEAEKTGKAKENEPVDDMTISAQAFMGIGPYDENGAGSVPSAAPSAAAASSAKPGDAAAASSSNAAEPARVDPTLFAIGNRVVIHSDAIDEMMGSPEEVETITGEYIGMGTFCFVQDARKVSQAAVVTEVRNGDLRFHFFGRDSKYDELINPKTSRITHIAGHPFQSTNFSPPFTPDVPFGTIVALAPSATNPRHALIRVIDEDLPGAQTIYIWMRLEQISRSTRVFDRRLTSASVAPLSFQQLLLGSVRAERDAVAYAARAMLLRSVFAQYPTFTAPEPEPVATAASSSIFAALSSKSSGTGITISAMPAPAPAPVPVYRPLLPAPNSALRVSTALLSALSRADVISLLPSVTGCVDAVASLVNGGGAVGTGSGGDNKYLRFDIVAAFAQHLLLTGRARLAPAATATVTTVAASAAPSKPVAPVSAKPIAVRQPSNSASRGEDKGDDESFALATKTPLMTGFSEMDLHSPTLMGLDAEFDEKVEPLALSPANASADSSPSQLVRNISTGSQTGAGPDPLTEAVVDEAALSELRGLAVHLGASVSAIVSGCKQTWEVTNASTGGERCAVESNCSERVDVCLVSYKSNALSDDTIRFYADSARTVLVKEVEGLGLLPPPFVVPNPFYIRVITSSKPKEAPAAADSKAKSGDSKPAGATPTAATADAKKKDFNSLPFTFAPLTVASFEGLNFIADVLIYTKNRLRMLASGSAAATAASVAPAFGSLDAALRMLIDVYTKLILQFHTAFPYPTNFKARTFQLLAQCFAAIMTTPVPVAAVATPAAQATPIASAVPATPTTPATPAPATASVATALNFSSLLTPTPAGADTTFTAKALPPVAAAVSAAVADFDFAPLMKFASECKVRWRVENAAGSTLYSAYLRSLLDFLTTAARVELAIRPEKALADEKQHLRQPVNKPAPVVAGSDPLITPVRQKEQEPPATPSTPATPAGGASTNNAGATPAKPTTSATGAPATPAAASENKQFVLPRITNPTTILGAIQRDVPLLAAAIRLLTSRYVWCEHDDVDPTAAGPGASNTWFTRGCACPLCTEWGPTKRTDLLRAVQLLSWSGTPPASACVSSTLATLWPTGLPATAPQSTALNGVAQYGLWWQSARSLPRNTRIRLFDEILNAGANKDKDREMLAPELTVRRSTDDDTAAPNAGPTAAAAAAAASASAAANAGGCDDIIVFREVAAALKLIPAYKLRAEVSKLTWKAKLGPFDEGSQGYGGPFRQSISALSTYLRRAALRKSESSAGGDSSSTGSAALQPLLIQCPNGVHQVGSDRDKLVINPVCTSSQEMSCYHALGQLIGVAIRSKTSLDLDFASIFWKLLLDGFPGCEVELDVRAEDGVSIKDVAGRDLASFDYNTYTFLQFRTATASGHQPMDEATFNSLELTWTTALSDGKTRIELVTGGRSIPVRYADRYSYAKHVARARFQESALAYAAIREGLSSVIGVVPIGCVTACPSPLALLSWQELELRVCGQPTLNLDVLKSHTAYAPKQYNADSPIVRDFWRVLESFNEKERASFLQFSWARSRLPDDVADKSKPIDQKSYRMQLAIEDITGPKQTQATLDQRLPHSETCFFNIAVPHYSSPDIMRAKLLLAMQTTSITH